MAISEILMLCLTIYFVSPMPWHSRNRAGRGAC